MFVGDLLEAETQISSLPRSILELSPQIVEKVMYMYTAKNHCLVTMDELAVKQHLKVFF